MFQKALKDARQFSPKGGSPAEPGWVIRKRCKLGGKWMYGMFAERDIPAHMYLGEFKGKRSYGTFDVSSDYSLQVERPGKATLYIDGNDTLVSSWCKYINEGNDANLNCKFVHHTTEFGVTEVYVYSTVPISFSQQLFIRYKY
jgi:hypothetical protein